MAPRARTISAGTLDGSPTLKCFTSRRISFEAFWSEVYKLLCSDDKQSETRRETTRAGMIAGAVSVALAIMLASVCRHGARLNPRKGTSADRAAGRRKAAQCPRLPASLRGQPADRGGHWRTRYDGGAGREPGSAPAANARGRLTRSISWPPEHVGHTRARRGGSDPKCCAGTTVRHR